MPRVILIGAVRFSERLAITLHNGPLELVGICTTSHPFGSDALDLTPLATELGVDVLDSQDLNDSASLAWLAERSPDVVVCAGWSRLLREELLRLPRLGVVGYHPAALPRNRGRHPIIWTLALGLPRAGSTFFLMDEGADSGPIISQRFIPVMAQESAASLYDRLNEVASEQLADIARSVDQTGGFESQPQDQTSATSWRKRSSRDGLVDWRMSATVIERLVRALGPPYPGAEFLIGSEHIRIVAAEVGRGPIDVEPGRVLAVSGDNATIMTGDGALCIRAERALDGLLAQGDAI